MYQMPWFKNDSKLIRTVLSGWQYSDITTLRSGTAIDPTLSVTGEGLATRPFRVAGQSLKGPKTQGEWFNTSAFTYSSTANAGYQGNSSIGLITGPGMVNFDMALYKEFPIIGSHVIQFRGEAFNIFNHTNFNAVTSTYGKSSFGENHQCLRPSHLRACFAVSVLIFSSLILCRCFRCMDRFLSIHRVFCDANCGFRASLLML